MQNSFRKRATKSYMQSTWSQITFCLRTIFDRLLQNAPVPSWEKFLHLFHFFPVFFLPIYIFFNVFGFFFFFEGLLTVSGSHSRATSRQVDTKSEGGSIAMPWSRSGSKSSQSYFGKRAEKKYIV